jgi:hemoglobin
MENTKTLYELVGDDRLQALINSFYAKVFDNPIIGSLFNQTDADTIKDKQYRFLSQFLGGPQRYAEKYGPPKMRRRHMPHAITTEAKDEWLKLMKASIYELDLPDHLKEALYNCFPLVAQHMVNN